MELTENLSLFPSASLQKNGPQHFHSLALFALWIRLSVCLSFFVFIYSFYNSFAHQLIKPYYIQLKTICSPASFAQRRNRNCTGMLMAQCLNWDTCQVKCADIFFVCVCVRLRLAKWNVSGKNQFSKEIETMRSAKLTQRHRH